MGDEQGKLLLFEGGDHLSTGMQNLTQLTNKYPQSDLAAYANFAIGMNWSRDFKNFHKKELRPANTEKSASHLENAKTKLLTMRIRLILHLQISMTSLMTKPQRKIRLMSLYRGSLARANI
jgi:hypothetical protein